MNDWGELEILEKKKLIGVDKEKKFYQKEYVVYINIFIFQIIVQNDVVDIFD